MFSKPDNSKQEARLRDQEKTAERKELQLAKELAARRKATGAGGKSKTLFQAVEGYGNATEKKTKLGALPEDIKKKKTAPKARQHNMFNGPGPGSGE
ncbi:MAG: hypothetical protein JRC87_11415, partial [Deltaproteobacteria bacterium]|nr:hypothetical protein [Deltaproteobacteria bacterium]